MFEHGYLLADRYTLDKRIGFGGMGEVWLATDNTLKRKVAVKVVHPHLVESQPDAVQILKQEAQCGATLIGHPNVVATLDLLDAAGDSGSFYCLVMEYVNGMDLQRWLKHVSTDVDAETQFRMNLLLAFQITEGLEFAKRNEVLHRDIKPLNVFVSDFGIAKIGDFGISRFVDAVTRTHTMWNAMSPAYAAPEQWKGEKPTLETDIYQLGCTLYHMFTKELPFRGENAFALMNQHLNVTPKRATELNAKIPSKISDAIAVMLNKAPKDRGELWKIHDAISEELIGKYKLAINLPDAPDDVLDIASKITDITREAIRTNKPITFPDCHEAISEGVELALSGILQFTLRKVGGPKTAKPKRSTSQNGSTADSEAQATN